MTTLDELRASARATVTIREAAEILEVDARTVSSAIKAGQIPAVRVGRRLLLPRHRLLAFIDGGDPSAESTEPLASAVPARDPVDELRAQLLRILLDEDSRRRYQAPPT